VGKLATHRWYPNAAIWPSRTANDPVLVEIVRRLVREFDPDRIYLFGSQARGDAGRDSDYDLMVIVPLSQEPEYRRAQRAHSLVWGLGVAADIMVWTRDAFDGRTHLRASLPSTILREGKLLYAA
jgi:predicted nucleotidyltransferase